MMKKLEVEFFTDGGPWCDHNYPCPIFYEEEKAVINLHTGEFEPSRRAQARGYRIIKIENKLEETLWRIFFAR